MATTKIKVQIDSVVPILFDRYSGINDQNDQEAQKNALLKLYRDDAERVSLPAACLKASIREASAEIGKKQESSRRKHSVRAGLFFDKEFYPLDKKKEDGIHAEIVTRKGTGNKVTRVVSYRPFVKEWSVTFEATLYALTPEFMKQVIELAGFKYGLCGHRPEYGRFVLKSFEIIEEAS